MYVKISTVNVNEDVRISGISAEIVRLDFNPSTVSSVEALKALAAAFITLCDRVAENEPQSKRHVALAKTAVEEAAMWGVKAATTGR